EEISYSKSFIIGCFQTLSILLPGLSRSAATIIGGMSQKLTRNLAAEFSFFLAVPTMFAASVKSFWDVYKEHPEVIAKDNMSVLTIGAVISFVVALLAVKFFISFVQKHGFRLFGWYRIILGVSFLVYIIFIGKTMVA
ncbi:MAG: undecaprenyl-diphosphate phosphatase, partial [Bacteroidia bacterium]